MPRGAAPALERNYNCLTFEGQGQGGVIHEQKIPFRHDCEKVVTSVVDYALTRIALMGISMGRYLAAKATAFENRIAACILNDGFFDGYDALASSFPKSLLTALDNGDSKSVNMVIDILMEFDPNIRFNIKHGMWTAGISTPFDLIQVSKNYTMKNIAGNIKCPTLVLEAENGDSFPGQPEKLFDTLTCPKKYILFTTEESADEHCQCGAPALSNQRIFDWSDATFQKAPDQSKSNRNIAIQKNERLKTTAASFHLLAICRPEPVITICNIIFNNNDQNGFDQISRE